MYDSPATYVSDAESHKGKKRRRCCKDCGGGGAFSKTAKEYSGASSIHGFAYIFEAAHGPFLRILWLLIVLFMAASGVWLSVQVRNGTIHSSTNSGEPGIFDH